jgi:hypothetical protein
MRSASLGRFDAAARILAAGTMGGAPAVPVPRILRRLPHKPGVGASSVHRSAEEESDRKVLRNCAFQRGR